MRVFTLLIAVACFLSAYAEKITVVASDTGEKLPGASVISVSGQILGICDSSGNFETSSSNFPLTIRSVGYQQASASPQESVIALAPISYSLPPLEVSPEDHPVTKVVCFIREYSTSVTGTDSLQLYGEYMATYFLADEKLKGFDKSDRKPKIGNEKRVCRISSKSNPDSIFNVKATDSEANLYMFKMLGKIPYRTVETPESILQGANSHIIPGKYTASKIYNKSPKLLTVTTDALSDYKNHTMSPSLLKLLGMTIDFQELQYTDAYNANDTGKYDISDLISTGLTFHAVGKGKMFKMAFKTDNEIHINSILEIYPMSVEYLTLGDYKEAKKDKTPLKFNYPSGLTQLATFPIHKETP